MKASKRIPAVFLAALLIAGAAVPASAQTASENASEKSSVSKVSVLKDSENKTSDAKAESSPEASVSTAPLSEKATEALTVNRDNSEKSAPEISEGIKHETISSISISSRSVVLETAQTKQMSVEVIPSNVSSDCIEWQSTNSNVASVNSSGVVTAKGVGTCTIKAVSTDGSNKLSYCSVTVTQRVANFEISAKPDSLKVGEKTTLSAIVAPSFATNKVIKWSSNNPDIASVSARGVVTALKEGTVTITAVTSDGSNISKNFTLKVEPSNIKPIKHITSITLNSIRKIINQGDDFIITGSVQPTDATNTSLTYVSSNTNVAEVDSNGRVYGKSKGTCVIYVSSNDGSKIRTGCVVTVEDNAFSVSMEKSLVCLLGRTAALNPVITPAGADTSNMVYRSSDTSVAQVDSSGVIRGISQGSCTVICVSRDGAKIYGRCHVTVAEPVSLINIHGDSVVAPNESINLTATVFPVTATNKNFVWRSSNESIARVDQKGKVYGVKSGTAIIRCIATDGSGIFGAKEITVRGGAANELVSIAKQQAGNGPSEYRSWFYGYDASDIPWCAIFVSWCFNQIDGINLYTAKTAGAGSIARDSIAMGLAGDWFESEFSDTDTTPQVGDVIEFVWNYSGRYYSYDKYYSDHVGIVYDVDDSFVYTVEGNAGSDDNDTSTVTLRSYSRVSGAINGYYRPRWIDN